MNYRAAWDRLIDELLACHARCGHYAAEEYRDIEINIECVLDLMEGIEEDQK